MMDDFWCTIPPWLPFALFFAVAAPILLLIQRYLLNDLRESDPKRYEAWRQRKREQRKVARLMLPAIIPIGIVMAIVVFQMFSRDGEEGLEDTSAEMAQEARTNCGP